MDELCKKHCINYLKITFLGKTVECCGGNVSNSDKCPLRKELYENQVLQLSKTELCRATGLKEEKLMRVLCRAEFASVRRIRQKNRQSYIEITPKLLDELRAWKGRGGPRCES